MRLPLVCSIALLAACSSSDDAGGDEDGGDHGPATTTCDAADAHSGEATYYDADGTGACSFAASPDDLDVAALNAPDWASAAWCGACADVTGPSGHVVVRIVDQCPECKTGDLDLSPQAFAKISPISAGRVAITWKPVACDVAGPIDYHFKEGSNPYWTAIQIRNHRYPITKLEARDATNTWHALPRATYNYFIADPGLGNGPYTLRVTDRYNHALEDTSVPFAPDTTARGSAQLTSCP